MKPAPPLRFITAAKAAELLSVSPADVAYIASRGELDSHDDDGRLMVSEESVRLYRMANR